IDQLGLAIISDIPEHLKLLQKLKILRPNEHCSRLPILRDLHTLMPIASPANNISKAIAKSANRYRRGNRVHAPTISPVYTTAIVDIFKRKLQINNGRL